MYRLRARLAETLMSTGDQSSTRIFTANQTDFTIAAIVECLCCGFVTNKIGLLQIKECCRSRKCARFKDEERQNSLKLNKDLKGHSHQIWPPQFWPISAGLVIKRLLYALKHLDKCDKPCEFQHRILVWPRSEGWSFESRFIAFFLNVSKHNRRFYDETCWNGPQLGGVKFGESIPNKSTTVQVQCHRWILSTVCPHLYTMSTWKGLQ